MPSKKITPEMLHRERVLWEAAESDHWGEPSCFFAVEPGNCSGRLQAAHLIPRQRLRKHVPKWKVKQAIADHRNGIVLCERHHGLLDRKLLELPREKLPESVEAFAEEYKLKWSLGRDYGKGR